MYSKLIPLLFLSLLLSSCCWFYQDDCAEGGYASFPLAVEFNYADTSIQVNEPLPISIKTSQFAPTYQEVEYQNSNFYMDIIWFDGNFSSTANSKIDLLGSNVGQFALDDYGGYNGPLPDDIDLEIAFTIPGYYLILFNGGVSKDYEESRRRRNGCGCGGYSYESFLFESNISNAQYFPLYNNSVDGSSALEYLNEQGAFFIKVE